MGQEHSLPSELVDQIQEEDPKQKFLPQLNRLYRIAQKVNRFECDAFKTNEVKLSALSYKDQHQNACVVRSQFSSFPNGPEGIALGDATLRNIFTEFKPLTTSRDSAYGIVATAGLRQASRPDTFMIVKYYFDTNPIPFLFETVIGMILNEIRRMLPNVMFTYGALYCSAPVNAKRTYQTIYDKNTDEYLEELLDFMSSQFQSFKNVSIDHSMYREFERACLSLIAQEFPFDKPERQNTLQLKILIVHRLIEEMQTLGYQINTSTQTIKEGHTIRIKVYPATQTEDSMDSEEERFWIQLMNKINHKQNLFGNQLYRFLKKRQALFSEKVKGVQDFNPQLLCDPTRPLSIILFNEWIPNSKTLLSYVNYKDVSVPNVSLWIELWAQLVFTLHVMWERCQFSHNDLHFKNILVREVEEPIAILFPFEFATVKIETRHIATLIDFGLGTLVYEQELIGYSLSIKNWPSGRYSSRHLNDLVSLHEQFSELYDELLDRFPGVKDQTDTLRMKRLVDIYRDKEMEPNSYVQLYYSIVKDSLL